MLMKQNSRKSTRFKKKTVVPSALEVLGSNQYGKIAKRVETAPVPVEEV